MGTYGDLTLRLLIELQVSLFRYCHVAMVTVLQLVKNLSNKTQLDMLFEGCKKETHVFEDMRQRETFCQLVQQLKNQHSTRRQLDQLSVFIGTWNMGEWVGGRGGGTLKFLSVWEVGIVNGSVERSYGGFFLNVMIFVKEIGGFIFYEWGFSLNIWHPRVIVYTYAYIYVCMYICMYGRMLNHAHIHTQIICKHIYIPTDTHMLTTHIPIHLHQTYTYTHTHTITIHSHTQTYTYKHTHTETYSYKHTYKHAHTQTYTHTHTYNATTHSHIHTQTYTYKHTC